MLKRTKGPAIRKQNERSRVKTVYLQGFETAITQVAEKRVQSPHCKQRPRTMDLFPQKAEMRVTYQVTDDGFITIWRIYVHIGSEWTCFYDEETRRIGTTAGKGNESHPEFIYLISDRLNTFIEVIGKIEDRLAAKQLVRNKPDVFELDEDTRLEVQHEEQMVQVPPWELEMEEED